MPDEDVLLVVKTRQKTADAYAITVQTDKFYEIFAPESAQSGQTVEVTVAVQETFLKIGTLLYNDQPCTYLSDDGIEYHYQFVMPARNVVLSATTEEDLHLVTKSVGEHTTLSVINCLYNQGTPEEKIQASQFTLVRFLFEAELGYEIECTVRSDSGETLSIFYDPDDENYGACWWVQMPDEPITIATSATEKNSYQGKDFVGTYHGFELHTADQPLLTGSTPALTLELKPNTAFTVVSTDRNAFDFDGMYVYDETADQFDYDRESCEKTYGISGRRLNGEIFLTTSNILDNKPDYNRFYFTSKEAFDYTCASPDPYDRKFLLEIRKGATTDYYYVDLLNYAWNRVEAAFDQGTSIAGNCSALLTLDGTPLFRYRVTDGATPIFTYKGSEAGTYRIQSGSGPDLVLDGFGRASLGGQSGDYTIEKGIVSFTADGKTVKFLIDPLGSTYYEVQSDEAWDGPAHLYAESETGYNSEVTSSGWIKGWVNVYMDSDFQGNAKPRYALIQMSLPDMFGRKFDIISDCVPYIYDPQAGTLVLSQVAQGRTDGWGQERRDITFTVTSGKSLVFTTEKVASMTTPNKYIYTLGLELTEAAEPAE